jgi:hypothetical protein
MYRTGLGDCFLLSFAGGPRGVFHMLVDCGVFYQTPNEKQILRNAAADIAAVTEGTIDVVVGTHEHYDHFIGFKHARDIFENLTIGEVWLAWSDKPGDQRAAWLRAIERKLKLGLQVALKQAMASPALKAQATGLRNLLEFEGNPLAADYSEQLGEVKRWLRDSASPSVRYLEPHGAAIEVVPGVRVYPLGPPLKEKFFRKMNDSKADPETYDTDFAFSGVPAFLSVGEAPDGGPGNIDRIPLALPFDRRWQIPERAAADWRRPVRPDERALGRARGEEFFSRRYGFGKRARDAWRRIDHDWLSEAESLALQLDSLTNNSSLALAIEIGPARRVILMAADAQVGNWLSWHEGTWRAAGSGGVQETVTAADLLGRTVLYKVGHHGSHNATLKRKGLEMMTADELVAMIPVNHDFAKNTKGWDMPFPGLLTELTRRTKGRVIRADTGLPAPAVVNKDAKHAFFNAVTETALYIDHFIPM